MLIAAPRVETSSMQGPGQPGVMPGTAGYQALLYQMQAGQFTNAGAANIGPRLALVQGGTRPAGMNAATLAAAAAAAGGGANFRQASAPMPMGMLLKAPARKTGGAQLKGRKHCNCKNSRCLKLYCECFASGRYCDNCNCVSCFNNKESEAVRQSAVEAILERNPNAFRPKIQTAEGDTHPQSIRHAPDGSVRHTKGCNCKKSACLKKYCECFQGNIFCTEVCKCVDCKNYDGSEARAQVLSLQEPFHIQQLHQAAAQNALKRQRLQISQAGIQQPTSAGLLQAQNAYQQLAAAAAAGGQPAQVMQPLQQLQAASAPQPQPSAPVAQVVPSAAVSSALGPSQQQPTAPQTPSRHPLLDVVHDLVKPELIEELGQLLVLVAKEEADKHDQQQQQTDADQTQKVQQPEVSAAADKANGVLAVKQEQDVDGVHPMQPTAEGQSTLGQSVKHGGLADTVDGLDLQPVVKAGDEQGDSVMQEAPVVEQQQQQALASVDKCLGDSQEVVSDSYAAQEAVVLQEFNAILQRIVAQAERKSSGMAAPPEAASTAAPAQTNNTSTGTASTDQTEQQSHQQQQQQQQSVQQRLQLHQQPLQQQQLTQQQQAQLSRPAVQQQRQPVLAIPQQAMMLQANSNLALAQLQQASRHAAYLQAAGGAGQPVAAFQSGLGVHMAGLRPMSIGMQQMVQVMAQDGTVHQIPASSLMQFQLAAAQVQQTTQSVVQQLPQQLPLQLSQPAPQPPAAAAPAVSEPPGLGVSLLSLLNGSNGPTPGGS